MTQINVLITGVGAAGFGEQILKSLKLSDLDLFLIGTDVSNICFNKDELSQFLVIPPVFLEQQYFENIASIIKNYKIHAIFPGSEPELKWFSRNREIFEGIFLGINNDEVINLCLNKFNTYERLRKLKVRLPKYLKINNMIDCKRVDFFPVVLKPNTGSGGSSNVYIAANSEELEMFVNYMLNNEVDIISQEYIGSSEEEYTIGVSSNHETEVLGCIIMRRIIKNGISINKKIKNKENEIQIISSGISQGEFIHHEQLKLQSEAIAKLLVSTGPLNIQGRLIDGLLYIFEINPRLSGTTSLRSMVGYNEPSNMLKANVLNEKNVFYHYEEKIVLRSLVEKILN